MSRISTMSTLMLFGRTAMQRAINRSRDMKLPKLKKSAADTNSTGEGKSESTTDSVAVPAASPRLGTRHRSQQKSFMSRGLGMWLPAMALFGMIMMSLMTMFVIVDAVRFSESNDAAVLRVSQECFDRLQQASSIAEATERATAVDTAISSEYSSGANWLTDASRALAKERFEKQGLAAFELRPADPRWGGSMATLSPAGRLTAMQATGTYVALINIAILCMSIGLMSRQLSGGDPSLTWLWQFPVSRHVLFSSKLMELVCDNPAAPITSLFYAAALWTCGATFLEGLGLGLLLGLAAAVTAAAVRLVMEIFMIQRLRRATRGAIVASLASLGSISILAVMLSNNSKFLIESFISISGALPGWVGWNPFTAGIGTESMMAQAPAWWLVAPLTAGVAAFGAVQFAVALTRSGLATANDSARKHRKLAATPTSRPLWLGVGAWKVGLLLRRHPEHLAQVITTPIAIIVLLYFSGYHKVVDLATQGAPQVSVAILVAVAYMLMVASVQSMTSEAKYLWMLQCQPRPLADIVRTNARIWGAIGIAVSIPFIGAAVAMRPGDALTILIRVPYLLAAIWLLAEVIFGLTALATTINNDQVAPYGQRNLLIPMLMISDVSLAIYNQSWWGQLSSLAMLTILVAAIRERQLVELPWLSDPVATPPKKVYPMHGLLLIIGFQALMGAARAFLLERPEFSAAAIMTASYCAGSILASAICAIWMSRNKLTLPALPVHAGVGKRIVLGLAACCAAGLLLTISLQWLNIDVLSQSVGNVIVRRSMYDKWYWLVLYVVAAPIFEEWAFRGVLYRTLRRNWSIVPSVAVTTILFVTLHPVASFPALIVLGIVTAWTTEKTGRLWPSILIHAGYNAMIWALWFT